MQWLTSGSIGRFQIMPKNQTSDQEIKCEECGCRTLDIREVIISAHDGCKKCTEDLVRFNAWKEEKGVN